MDTTSLASGNCGKCGICLMVCPVYSVLKEEQASPRARIQLIRAFERGDVNSSPLLKELISKCLLCGRCAGVCPSGVDHYSRFMEMRSQLIEDQGDRADIRGLVYLLAKEQRLRLSMGAAKLGQRMMPKRLQQKFDVGNIPLDRYPKLNKKPFRNTIPEETPAVGEERGTVLYFTGCATNYIFDSTGSATVNVLSNLGYRVITPKTQCCCSIPMIYHGGVDDAVSNIETNVRAFSQNECEAIIVDCPTCGSAFNREFSKILAHHGKDTSTAEGIAGKTVDLVSFLADRVEELNFPGKHDKEITVTYHQPCHLDDPDKPVEKLLKNIPGITYVPCPDVDQCCGGGGTFFYEFPEVSAKISSTKIENGLATAASIWLTDCPVCRMNLEGQLPDDANMVMMHPIVFLEQLLQRT